MVFRSGISLGTGGFTPNILFLVDPWAGGFHITLGHYVPNPHPNRVASHPKLLRGKLEIFWKSLIFYVSQPSSSNKNLKYIGGAFWNWYQKVPLVDPSNQNKKPRKKFLRRKSYVQFTILGCAPKMTIFIDLMGKWSFLGHNQES